MAMTTVSPAAGASEIHQAVKASSRSLACIGPFSAFVNLLMLTGAIFMLQGYDRVLASRSEATLVALAGVVACLFLMMGLLDHFRARVLARAGARFRRECARGSGGRRGPACTQRCSATGRPARRQLHGWALAEIGAARHSAGQTAAPAGRRQRFKPPLR